MLNLPAAGAGARHGRRRARENTPLQVISDRTGLTKSSIWRHGRRLVKAEGAATPPKALPKAKTVEPALPAVRTQTPALPVSEPPVDVEASRKRALDRAEDLWSEVSECLQLAREPVKIVKPDGTELKVPVDLRTRSSVIRAGKDVIDLDARLNGLYDRDMDPRNVTIARVVLFPKVTDLPEEERPPAIEGKVELSES